MTVAEPNAQSPVSLATLRRLVRPADRAALAPVPLREGQPYVSLVALASDYDGAPLMLLSALAEHSRAIGHDPRAALLIDGTAGAGDLLNGPRLTLQGRMTRLEDPRLRRRFLAAHPKASLYADFSDFSFYRLVTARNHWVGGFGSARWIEGAPVVEEGLARIFAAADEDVCAKVNHDLGSTVDAAMAKQQRSRRRGWQITSVDPDGCWLAGGGRSCRLAFADPLSDPDEIADALDRLGAGIASEP